LSSRTAATVVLPALSLPVRAAGRYAGDLGFAAAETAADGLLVRLDEVGRPEV